MKLSALQLNKYCLTDIAVTANTKFNPEREYSGALEHFSANTKATPLESGKDIPEHSWLVELTIAQEKDGENNYPYDFRASVMGIFCFFDKAIGLEKETNFVQVNGSSVLYGLVREHIRALTATGPWGSIIIPTISFTDLVSGSKKIESAKSTKEK